MSRVERVERVEKSEGRVVVGNSAAMREARWQLGHEYEYAYCSNCGHQQYVGWETRADAKVMVGEFHNVYKFCPNCGAQMKGETDGSK